MSLRKLLQTSILLSFLAPGLASAGWSHRILSRGLFAAIAVGPEGKTHYLYESEGGKYRGLIHQVLDSRGRKISADNIPDSSNTASLAVDQSNHLHLLFRYSGYSTMPRYGFFDGSAWSFQDVPTSLCTAMSIAVDSANHPHIACVTGSPYGSLIHLSYDGSVWTSETVVSYGYDPAFDSVVYVGTSGSPIRIAADGALHIGFGLVVGVGSEFVCDAVKSVDTWSRNCSTGTAGGRNHLSMALDSGGNPYFCYLSTGGLTSSHFDGASWFYETVDANADANVNYSEGSIAVGPDDVAKILYIRKGRTDSVVYAVRDDGTWRQQVIGHGPGLHFLQADGLSLDPLGLPHGGLSALPAGPNFAIYGQLTLPDLTGAWDSIITGVKNRRFTVTGKLRVKNGGTATAGGFSVRYYLSDDDQLDPSDIAIGKAGIALGVGRERVFTFNYRPTGSVAGKYLIAQISAKKPGTEALTNNNLASGAIP